MLNEAFFVETHLDISFHTFRLINSTYPSTIWDKSSASYARALAKNSVSDYYNINPTNDIATTRQTQFVQKYIKDKIIFFILWITRIMLPIFLSTQFHTINYKTILRNIIPIHLTNRTYSKPRYQFKTSVFKKLQVNLG